MQVAQSNHAMAHFFYDHPSVARDWLVRSNYLVVVSVPDEDALLDLVSAVHSKGLLRSAVREPDLEDQATAVAIQPGTDAQRLCSRFPLTLREAKMIPA